jgi:carboxyl-terminal processing protease
VNDQIRKNLSEYIVANKINLPALSERDRTELEKRIKTWMARQIWGMPGFYEANNAFDLTVQKALQVN